MPNQPESPIPPVKDKTEGTLLSNFINSETFVGENYFSA